MAKNLTSLTISYIIVLILLRSLHFNFLSLIVARVL
jgi:hypothetical protein